VYFTSLLKYTQNVINEHIFCRIPSIVKGRGGKKNSSVVQQEMASMLQPRGKKIMAQRLEAAFKDFSPASGNIHTALVN